MHSNTFSRLFHIVKKVAQLTLKIRKKLDSFHLSCRDGQFTLITHQNGSEFSIRYLSIYSVQTLCHIPRAIDELVHTEILLVRLTGLIPCLQAGICEGGRYVECG